jgi:glycerol-3-phosphate dehydrogenase (NAD(P)+)
MTRNVTVLGAGSWGTTLAAMCARRWPTTIWALEDEVVEEIMRAPECAGTTTAIRRR